MVRTAPTRRQFLQGALATGSALLLGCNNDSAAPTDALLTDGGDGAIAAGDCLVPAAAPGCADPFAGGACLGRASFTGEGTAALDVATGLGHDGRLYHDLSNLRPDNLITPNDRFYLHTRFPDLIDEKVPWKITISGLVKAPRELSMADLAPLVQPMGTHIMECSGNGSFAHFGMLSVATWAGVPMAKVLSLVDLDPKATRVLVSGFDMHTHVSMRSVPGASWIFTFQQLADFGAFLATEMNGVPLPKDHGAPVRLLVPRWYGCTCVKWVNEIQLVDDTAPATSQMLEYASRTSQNGTPALAKDYIPASMDQAAMPIRVEKWRVGGRILYNVVGILWGGARPTDKLQIRFARNEPWVDVNVCPAQTVNDPWTLWSHAWQPAQTGDYAVLLRVNDPQVAQRRLDSGFYVRTVNIDEV